MTSPVYQRTADIVGSSRPDCCSIDARGIRRRIQVCMSFRVFRPSARIRRQALRARSPRRRIEPASGRAFCRSVTFGSARRRYACSTEFAPTGRFRRMHSPCRRTSALDSAKRFPIGRRAGPSAHDSASRGRMGVRWSTAGRLGSLVARGEEGSDALEIDSRQAPSYAPEERPW